MDPTAWGIVDGYHDIEGHWHPTPPETTRALLEAMGATTESPPPAPVRVVRAGTAVQVEGRAEVEVEDGGSFRFEGLLPPDLPPGYHRLIEHDNARATTLIVSPGRCFLPPDLMTWGWAIQLYALRSSRSWGLGDLADLRAAARWARAEGAGAVMINPLHAAHPEQPSPYYPSSRCFSNPLYIAVEETPGAAAAAGAVERAAAAGRALTKSRTIDRTRVHALKRAALEAVWRAAGPDEGFAAYREQRGPLLEDFATFSALSEEQQRPWPQWAEGLRSPRSGAVERWRTAHEDSVSFHAWLQYLLDSQLTAAADETALVRDVAVGVDPAGADAWLFGDVFAPGVTAGAPPDEFNRSGQGWGVLAFDPHRLRHHAFGPFIETLRAALRGGGGIRYDHVMGLWRLFWIPPGGSPADGTYVRYPAPEMLDILALESHRAGAFVVGEDLGTVEEGVREEMAARHMLSYRVLWFEPGPPEAFPRDALAAVTNHDLPTVPGLWTGADADDQRRAGIEPAAFAPEASKAIAAAAAGTDPADAVRAAYGLLARAPSRLLMATLEDALGVLERPNLPGTTDERPNWSLALPLPLEDIVRHGGVAEIARLLRRP